MAKSTPDSRRGQVQEVGSIFQRYLKAFKLEKRFKQAYIRTNWETIMSPVIAKRTESIYFKEQKLFIVVGSPSLRNELFLMREQIKSRVNEALEEDFIQEVIIR